MKAHKKLQVMVTNDPQFKTRQQGRENHDLVYSDFCAFPQVVVVSYTFIQSSKSAAYFGKSVPISLSILASDEMVQTQRF